MILFDWIIPIRLTDLAEIAIVAFILYKLYQLMRGTIAVQIFIGIVALYVMQVLVSALNMTMLRVLFGAVSEVFVLAVIILFQPEIRRVLLLLGQNPLVRRFVRTAPAQDEMINEIVASVTMMSRQRIGALIVLARSTGLRSYIETGAQLHARVTRDLLVTIFFAQNPLHDGAVIIQNQRLEAARCILPVSTSMKVSPHLGLRHRAAVGLTEQTDAFVIIVSEETGNISLAENGTLISNVAVSDMQSHLTDALSHRPSDSIVTGDNHPSA
jgi:diadenylate cyclase